MKYVICMGFVYRLSNRAYVEFLRARAASQPESVLEEKGKFLGAAKDVTDLGSDEAEDLLATERLAK